VQIDGFIDKDEFKSPIDDWIHVFRNTKPAPGTNGPLIPGDPERAAEVSIALQYENETLLGLVYDPIRNECFKAMRQRGATLNDKPIKVSTTNEVDKSLLATGFPYDCRDCADFYLTYFKAFMTRCQGIRRGGSAALDLCYLACGRLDGFWELKLKPWDTAAGSLILNEAGGKLSDFFGNPFTIWGEETLASNRLIHDEMVGIAERVVQAHVD